MNGAVKTVLIVLAALALLFAFLCFKIKFRFIHKNGETDVYVKYLFFKKRIDLQKKDSAQDKKEKTPKKQGEKKDKKKKRDNRPLSEQISDFVKLISSAGALAKLALSLFKANIKFKAAVSEQDAAKTAIKCGKILALAHSSAAVIGNFTQIENLNVGAFPCYDGEKTTYDVDIVLWSRPVSIIKKSGKIIKELLAISDATSNKKQEQKERKK